MDINLARTFLTKIEEINLYISKHFQFIINEDVNCQALVRSNQLSNGILKNINNEVTKKSINSYNSFIIDEVGH